MDQITEKLKQLGGRRKGFTQQSVAVALLTKWIGGQERVTQDDLPRSDGYSDDLAQLLTVLQHGTPKERELLRSTIKHHAESVRSRSENPSQLRTARPVRRAASK